LFDSLPQDAYRVVQGHLMETHLALSLSPDTSLTAAMPDFRQLVQQYSHHPVTDVSAYQPYDNPLWNRLVRETAQRHYNASFLIPIGALRTLDWMDALTQGHWCLLASDKGSQRLESQLDVDDPDLVAHDGAFSLSINFHTLEQWFTHRGGQSLNAPVNCQQPIHTFAAVRGLQPLPATHALPQALHRHFGPVALTRAMPAMLNVLGDVKPLEGLKFNQQRIDALLEGIRLSLCDPLVISRLTRVIYPFLPDFSINQRQDLLTLLNRGQQLYFAFPAEPLYPLSLGIFLVALCMPDKAIVFIRQAMALQPQNAHVYLWLGKAYDQLHNPRKARDCFYNACLLDPSLVDAQDRLAALTIILDERPTESDYFTDKQ
jgi:tetratricopeptide (TPR) repeat protein